MKKTVCAVIMVLWLITPATSFSYAQNNKTNETLLANVMLKGDDSPGKLQMPEKKLEHLYAINHDHIKIEQSALHEEMGGEGRVFYRENFDVPFKSYINKFRVHQPLIYKNFDFYSHDRIITPYKSSVPDLEFSSVLSGVTQGGIFHVGTAFLTNLVLHELGHVVVANYVGANGTKLSFLKKQGNSFFLGTTTVDKIDDKSRLPLSMGGEMASDLTFEHALQSYRKNPTLYNKSLLFFSGVDFLWYTFYAFYLSDGHPYFDPTAISKETGISKDVLFSTALAKTVINAYRVYSGQDKVIPYFTVDKYSAILNFSIAF